MNIHSDIPDRIETERLIIRAPKEDDIKIIHKAKIENRDILQPWFFWAQTEQDFSLDEAKRFIRTQIAEWAIRKNFQMMVFEKETENFVGSTGIHPKNTAIGRYEIGYWQDKTHHGKGYMTESSHALLKFAFDHFNAQSVLIRADVRNTKSRAIPERLGFTLEGVLHASEPCYNGGKPRDMAQYICLDPTTVPDIEYTASFSSGVKL